MVTRDPKQVERNKKAAAEPQPTPEEKEAARKRKKEKEKAELERKAAELKKQEKKRMRKKTQERFDGVCHMCKQTGHIARHCPNPICSECGEGHHAEHCLKQECEGCIAYEITGFQGHIYHNCPFRAENPFCTFCKHRGHEISDCRDPCCKKAKIAAATKEAAEKAAEHDAEPPGGGEYDPNRPGLGFKPAAGASLDIGLGDFDLDALTDEQFQEYLNEKEAKVYRSESRKLAVERVVASAKKKAAAEEKASPKSKGYGSTKRMLDYEDDEGSATDQEESDGEESLNKTPTAHGRDSISRSQRSPAIHQGRMRAEQALRSPLPSSGFQVRTGRAKPEGA